MIGGILLLIPSQAFEGAWQTEVAGAIVTAMVVGRELLAKRKLQAA